MSSDPNVHYVYEFLKEDQVKQEAIIAQASAKLMEIDQKIVDIRAKCKHDWQIIDKTELISKCLNDNDFGIKQFSWTRKCFICDKTEFTSKSKLVPVEQPDFE